MKLIKEVKGLSYNTLGVIKGVSKSAPVAIGKARSSIRLLPESLQLKKMSDLAFNRFKQIMNHNEMLLEISLLIWKTILLDVFGLDLLINLIVQNNNFKELEYIFQDFKLNLVAFDTLAYKVDRSYGRVKLFRFVEYPYQFLKIDQMNSLLDWMESRNMKFESLVFDDIYGDQRYYEPGYDYPMSLKERICNSSKIVSYNKSRYAEIPFNTTLSLMTTNLKISDTTIYLRLQQFINLSELTIVMPQLLDPESYLQLKSVFDFCLPYLKTLKLQYSVLLAHEKINVFRISKKIVELFELNNGISIQISCDDLNKLEQYNGSVEPNIEIFKMIMPLRKYLRKVELPLHKAAISDLKLYPDLTNLLIKSSAEYNGSHIRFISDSLQQLSISGLRSSLALSLDLRHLHHLKILSFEYATIPSATMRKLPSSIKRLQFNSCSLYGPLNINENLTVLKLWYTYPKLNFSKSMKSHLKVGIRWLDDNQADIENMSQVISNFSDSEQVRYIKFENEHSCLRYVKLTPLDSTAENSYFSIEYSEIIQGLSKFKLFDKTSHINISGESSSMALRKLSESCMKSFQQQKNVLADSTSWSTNVKKLYSVLLKKQLKKDGLTYKINLVESKIALPILYNCTSGTYLKYF